jgi:hypothetical protein
MTILHVLLLLGYWSISHRLAGESEYAKCT